METKSDTLKLSLKDNEELKTELGGAQPGDTLEICLTVTVSAVDDDQFEAAIDEVVVEGDTEAEEPAETEDSEEEDPALLVIAKKKKVE